MQDQADWTPIRTERLMLRKPVDADLAQALELHLDPQTNLHHPEPQTVTEASVTAKFRSIIDHWHEHGFGVWVVALQENPQQLIGVTGLSHRLVHERPALNLYYRYRPEAWGRGIASEAAAFAVHRGRALLPQLPITAYTTLDNLGSQRTALAVGLQRHPELDVTHDGYSDIFFTIGW